MNTPQHGATGVGMKFDGDKVRFDLLHPEALVGVANVLTYGARKYASGNWRKVKHGRKRYFGALLRHLYAWVLGEKTDPETGMPHLDHALCCLMFIRGLDAENIEEAPTPCEDPICEFCFPGKGAKA